MSSGFIYAYTETNTFYKNSKRKIVINHCLSNLHLQEILNAGSAAREIRTYLGNKRLVTNNAY